MNRNRLSCLTPLALLTVLVTLVVLLGVRYLSGSAMFSPGPLNAQSGSQLGSVTSHAQIDKNCAACHPAPWSAQTMADRCLVCHTEIAETIQNPSTLHGALADQNPSYTCRNCHPEHRGPSAALTEIATASFPHQMVGFSLDAHVKRSDNTPFICADCHTENLTAFDKVVCADCHHQIDTAFMENHLQAYSSDCLACHDGMDRYSQFDHQAGFQLTGAHLQANCRGCHQNPRSPSDFQTAPSTCEGCHLADDAHNGEYGTSCAACHTPNGWSPASFDHNLADFKLEGQHVEVECASCHVNAFIGTPTDCYSCHYQDDPHSGEFGMQCEGCHNPTGWQNVTFDHNQAAFPLDGAHLQVACQDCHQNNIVKGTPLECAGCHSDPDYHAGMFPGQTCSDCHNTTAWRPAIYNGPHSFPMDHGERINTCADCHQPNLTTWTCYLCHDQGEITQKHQEEGISDFNDCLTCHATGQKEEHEGGDY